MALRRATCGKGWRQVEGLATDEFLLVRDFSAADRRMQWVLLDPASRSRVRPLAHPQPNATRPIWIAGTSGIVYSSIRGITSFDVGSGQEELLCPLDYGTEHVKQMWLLDERLYYILGRSQVSLQALEAKAVAARRPIQQEVEESFSLWSLAKRPNAEPRLNMALPEAPSFADIDRDGGTMFIAMDDGRLMSINLAKPELTRLGRFPDLDGVLVSPRRTLIRWGFRDSGIKERATGGRFKALTGFGRLPAFAPTGELMAFVRNSEELWLLNGRDGPAELVLKYPASGTLVCDAPVWCPCGCHVSVLLTASGASRVYEQTLVIASVSEKAVEMIPPANPASFNGGRVWIPKRATKTVGASMATARS